MVDFGRFGQDPPAGVTSAGQTVVNFLSSLGQRSEAEMYLRHFRQAPAGRFALIVPTRPVLEESSGIVVEQLSFLRELGLSPSLLLGASEEVGGDQLRQFEEFLLDVGLHYRVTPLDADEPTIPAEVLAAPRTEGVQVFHLPHPSDAALARVATALSPRKVILLRGLGGLGPHDGTGRLEVSPGHFLEHHDSGIGVINLRSDFDALSAGCYLSEEDTKWLRRARAILEQLADDQSAPGTTSSTRTTVTVASPLSLMRELFTVRGDGTLVKLGAALTAFSNYGDIEQERLLRLLQESFGREVRPEFWEREPDRIYLENNYRGVALLEPGQGASFLSKFAVLPVARGEGLGQDLWWSLARETAAVYWRSRPDNPINVWYSTVCDGMHRGQRWQVYWRGVPARRLPEIIADAESRPEDFVPRP